MDHSHIQALSSFLQNCQNVSDEDMEGKFKHTRILLQHPPHKPGAAQASVSRHKQAQKHLDNIRTTFGDPFYYFCLCASSVSQLCNKETYKALKEWIADDKPDIPAGFTRRAQALVDKALVGRASNSDDKPGQKRRHNTAEEDSAGSAAPTPKPKRVRLKQGSGIMSVERIITQPTPGEDQGDTLGTPKGHNNENNEELNASREEWLGIQNEGGMSYQDLLTSLENSSAAQLVAGNDRLSQGHQASPAAATGGKVDPKEKAAEYSEAGNSDDSDDNGVDENHPSPEPAPAQPTQPAQPVYPPYPVQPVYPVQQVPEVKLDGVVFEVTAREAIHLLSDSTFKGVGTVTMPTHKGTSPFIMFRISGKDAKILIQGKKKLM